MGGIEKYKISLTANILFIISMLSIPYSHAEMNVFVDGSTINSQELNENFAELNSRMVEIQEIDAGTTVHQQDSITNSYQYNYRNTTEGQVFEYEGDQYIIVLFPVIDLVSKSRHLISLPVKTCNYDAATNIRCSGQAGSIGVSSFSVHSEYLDGVFDYDFHIGSHQAKAEFSSGSQTDFKYEDGKWILRIQQSAILASVKILIGQTVVTVFLNKSGSSNPESIPVDKSIVDYSGFIDPDLIPEHNNDIVSNVLGLIDYINVIDQ